MVSGGKLDAGREAVGAGLGDLVLGRALAGGPLGQVDEGATGRSRGTRLGLAAPGLGIDHLDLGGRVLGVVEAVEDAERDASPLTTMSRRPSSKRSRTSSTSAVQPTERAPSASRRTMPKGLALVQGVADHPLVAVLEDVQRDPLARQEDEGQLEDRQLHRHRPAV